MPRRASASADEERQPLITSARDGLTVLLSFLLGFALPMALPHYEQRKNLMISEANAIATVDQRVQMLPGPVSRKNHPIATRICRPLASSSRTVIWMSRAWRRPSSMANQLQNEMWQENVAMVQQYPNLVLTPIFTESLGQLSDLNEQRFSAYEPAFQAPSGWY